MNYGKTVCSIDAVHGYNTMKQQKMVNQTQDEEVHLGEIKEFGGVNMSINISFRRDEPVEKYFNINPSGMYHTLQA